MNKNMIFLIICFFLLSMVLSPTIHAVSQQASTENTYSEKGGMLYVGGTGPGNYSSIQNAIDNASNGDTVFVFADSSPYEQSFVVNKSLTIQGENPETTILDGKDVYFDQGIMAYVRAEQVTISGFRFENHFKGVEILYVGNATICNNVFYNIENGIYLHLADYNTIKDNTIIEGPDIIFDFTGIYIYGSHNYCSNNTIIVNTFHRFDAGIYLGSITPNQLYDNSLYNCSVVAWEDSFIENECDGNTINDKPIIFLKDQSHMTIDYASQLILINCHDIIISDLDLQYTHTAILLYLCSSCQITNCTFTDNFVGIRLSSCNSIELTNNVITNGVPKPLRFDESIGLWLSASESNTITHNQISKNGLGIQLQSSDVNTISYNKITRNRALNAFVFDGYTGGIKVITSNNNLIKHNTFIGNVPNVFELYSNNRWRHNYWNRPWVLPKPIFGLTEGGWMEPPKLSIHFDWRPALLPPE